HAAGVIQRFEGHAGAERAIADDRHDATLLLAARSGDRHAERRADRRARMANTERVVFALAARRKRREAVLQLDRAQLVAAPGQYLVRIGLMTDVPHDAVVRRIEDVMQGDRELDGAEAGREVAAHLRDRVDE